MKQIYLTVLISVLFAVAASGQPASFAPRGVGGGGALFAPRINPGNSSEFYVACDMSEMFHSTDFGNTYSQINFTKLQALNVSTYEYTNNPSIAYSNFNDGNNGYPVKTTDGGNTWTQLPGFDPNEGEVYSMRSNYNNPSQLLMDYYNEIVISNDGGATFQVVQTAANNGVGLIMGGAFFDGNNIYIGTNQGIYYSTNAGVSFSLMTATGIPAGQVIWQFAGAKQGNTTRFVCITGLSANIYNGVMPWNYSGIAAGVYAMDNASGTWQPRTGTINVANDYVMYIGMAWNNITTIYLGGNDAALNAPLVYKTTNGGMTWSKTFLTTNNQNIITGWSGTGGDKAWSWGQSVYGISVAPYDSSKVIISDESELHVSSDGGANWKQAYVNNNDDHPAAASTPQHQVYHSIGLENTTCWQVDWQSATSMMAGFSDIGAIRSADSGRTWGYTYTGLTANSTYRIAKTPGGTMFAANSGIHDMYQSTRLKDAQLDVNDASGKINYSTDHGATWSTVHSFNHPVFWIAIDPNDSNKMYASVINHGGGLGGIWMTSNLNNLGTSTWTQLPAPPRSNRHPASIIVLNDGKVVCSYSGRINPAGAWTDSSGVYLYNPTGGTWTDVSDINMHYWTKDVVLDPTDATQNTWYACVFTGWGNLAGTGQGGLYKTTNRGTSWTKLTASLFDRVTSITFNPQNAAQAYLTTETQGLWYSANMNTGTPTWTLVSSYPFRQPERVFFNPYNQEEMWVTSFGNGLKMGNLNNIINVGEPTFGSEPTALLAFPNPTQNSLSVVLPAIKNNKLPVIVYDESGRFVTQYYPGSSSQASFNTAIWPAGIYIVSFNNLTTRVIKNR